MVLRWPVRASTSNASLFAPFALVWSVGRLRLTFWSDCERGITNGECIRDVQARVITIECIVPVAALALLSLLASGDLGLPSQAPGLALGVTAVLTTLAFVWFDRRDG